MRHPLLVAAAVGALLHAAPLIAAIPVEQIEALELETGDGANDPTGYAPVDFNGQTTADSGSFPGITFHAEAAGMDNTLSSHAIAVGVRFYASGTPGAGYVTDVYDEDADYFFGIVNPQMDIGTGDLPGTFVGGAQVINNSYIADGNGTPPQFSDVDALRRLDYMIAQADVTFVAAAVSELSDPITGNPDYYSLDWSAYNSLAVTGDEQTFNPNDTTGFPNGPPGKTHADLFGGPGDASFSAGSVSSAALGLYGNAQAAGQADAQHGVVVRSLLMAGADKGSYTGPFTANHLSVQNGAGTLDYASSLSILQAGEQPIVSGGNSTLVSATPTGNASGWAYGSVAAAGNSYVFFHSSGQITSVTASLNWDVSQSATATTIDTSDDATLFPNIGLELVPVTNQGGNEFAIGAAPNDDLMSILPANSDNEQYLYYTGTLPAGDYAFEFIGDPSLSTPVGFSYSLTEVPEPGALGAASLAVAGWCVRRRRIRG